MKISSPYRIKEVKFQRNYPGYIYRRELVDDSDFGGNGALEMVNCYESENGQWIGSAKTARMLCKKYGLRQLQKIKDSHCVCSIGFNEKEQKWYGWSHRAIYGFGIGSTCTKSDCSYCPTDETDAIEDGIRFWSEADHLNVRAEDPIKYEGYRGVWIRWEYAKDIPNEKSRGTTGGTFHCFPDAYGKGEWISQSIEDAKQMAIDFAEGVS